MLDQNHIDYHFRINSLWKELFLRKYPQYTPEDYVENAWKLFEENGYTYEIVRYSNKPTSMLYKAVKEISLMLGDEEVICLGDLSIHTALEQLLIEAITSFDVNFTNFK